MLIVGCDYHPNSQQIGTRGLREVPLRNYLFSTQDRDLQHEEIVFLNTPHVTRGKQIEPLNLKQINTGTRIAGEPCEGRPSMVSNR